MIFARTTENQRLLLFLLFGLVLCLDTTFLGPLSMVRIHDTFDSEFFNYFARGRLLLEHGVFGWHPDWAGGMPAFAALITPYYILNLASTVVPIWLINAILRVLLSTLAGWGMYRLLREHLHVHFSVAIALGCIFQLTMMDTIPQRFFEHVFPFYFVCSLDVFDGLLGFATRLRKMLWLLLLLLLGYPIITMPFFAPAHLALVLWLGGENTRRRVLGTFCLWTGWVLTFAPAFIQLLQYIPLAQRSYEWVPYADVATLIRRYVFLFTEKTLASSMLLLLCAFLPNLGRGKRSLYALLFIIVPGAFASFMQGRFSEVVQNSFFAKMDLDNINFLVPLGFVMVIALALDRSLKEKKNFNIYGVAAGLLLLAALHQMAFFSYIRILIACVIFLLAATLVHQRNSHAATSNAPRFNWKACAVTMLLCIGVVASYEQLFLKHYHMMYSKTFGGIPGLARLAEEAKRDPFRVGCVNLPPAVVLSNNLETPEYRGPLSNKYYKQLFFEAIKPQAIASGDSTHFASYWYDLLLTYVSPKATGERALDLYNADNWNANVLRLMNIRYLVSFRPITGIERIADFVEESTGKPPLGILNNPRLNAFSVAHVWIYKIRDSFPRGWLTNSSVCLQDRAQVLEALATQPSAVVRRTAYLASEDLPAGFDCSPQTAGNTSDQPGTVAITKYTPDRIVFEGEANGPCLLVVANNFDPGWSAKLNSRTVPLVRADHAFMALQVAQKGPFRVDLEWNNPLVWRAHWLVLLGLLLYCSTIFLGNRPSPGTRLGVPDDAALPCEPLAYGVVGLCGGIVGLGWLIRLYLEFGKPWSNGYTLYWSIVLPCAGLAASFWCRRFIRLAGATDGAHNPKG